MQMSLTVRVKSASNLPNIERIGKSDPFVVLKFRGALSKLSSQDWPIFDTDLKKETKVIANELNPVWNEVWSDLLKLHHFSYFIFQEFPWSLQAPLGGSEVLTIEVYDKETIGKDRSLWCCTIKYYSFVWHVLLDCTAQQRSWRKEREHPVIISGNYPVRLCAGEG